MEHEFYTDEFEQLLKEKADQFSMYPSKRVWHSIYNNLHPSRRWPSVIISLFFISSLILIGYLNTGKNSITRQINSNAAINNNKPLQNEIASSEKNNHKTPEPAYAKIQEQQGASPQYNNAFEDVITNETDFYSYTIVKSNRPVKSWGSSTTVPDVKPVTETIITGNNEEDVVQNVNNYIRSHRIFADVAALNRKNKNDIAKTPANTLAATDANEELNTALKDNVISSLSADENKTKTETVKLTDTKTNTDPKNDIIKTGLTNEEKAWIEDYAMQNKPAAKKWKGRLGYQVYVTPAVNYRKLTTKAKGSATPFATADINKVISQKPGFGFEAGFGLNYAAAKRLQLKAGVQFNYTNYNINADKTGHPVTTTILLNDPSTGYSYSAARTSSSTNTFNTPATRPVTLHNRTYQVSLPIGFAYKLSSQNNVEWFAGATVQPTYYFGGKAHLISSDLKNYVYDPSSINAWNINLGFETYMNFKMGSYNLQVGPQVRYQVNSTYKKDVALIEKPYAIGLKFGLTKGF